MNKIVNHIRKELNQASEPSVKESMKRFFKEPHQIKSYGVTTANIGKISKSHDKEVLAMPKKEVFALCNALWKSGMYEESIVACHYAYLIRKTYQPADFKVFETWVNTYVSNWASCDTLCNHTVGAFVDMYPQVLADLKRWAKSKNRWTKRASAVSLIIPAREGRYLKDVFDLADILLTDQDDMVQKGYGWLLKSAGDCYQQEVFDFVMQNKARMPRTALRYAIEKMPKELKARAMVKD